jgi:hypothetical protein
MVVASPKMTQRLLAADAFRTNAGKPAPTVRGAGAGVENYIVPRPVRFLSFIHVI